MFTKSQAVKNGKRNVNDSDLVTVELNDLINEIKADTLEVKVREDDDVDEEDASYFLIISNSVTGDLYPINFGKSSKRVGIPTTEEGLDDIINKCLIFTGERDVNGKLRDKPWFSFGVAGNNGTTVVKKTVKEVLASLSSKKALAGGVKP